MIKIKIKNKNCSFGLGLNFTYVKANRYTYLPTVLNFFLVYLGKQSEFTEKLILDYNNFVTKKSCFFSTYNMFYIILYYRYDGGS